MWFGSLLLVSMDLLLRKTNARSGEAERGLPLLTASVASCWDYSGDLPPEFVADKTTKTDEAASHEHQCGRFGRGGWMERISPKVTG